MRISSIYKGVIVALNLLLLLQARTSPFFFMLSLTSFFSPQLAPAVTSCVVDLNTVGTDLTWQRWVFVAAT